MKKILFCLSVITVAIISCSKSSDSEQGTSVGYLGTYTSNTKDTVKITKNGSYVKFVYISFESIHTPVPPPTTTTPIGNMEAQYMRTFDSVRVASDLSFTDNEYYSSYTHYTGNIYPLPVSSNNIGTNTGIGVFANNTVTIHFDALVFTGIKL